MASKTSIWPIGLLSALLPSQILLDGWCEITHPLTKLRQAMPLHDLTVNNVSINSKLAQWSNAPPPGRLPWKVGHYLWGGSWSSYWLLHILFTVTQLKWQGKTCLWKLLMYWLVLGKNHYNTVFPKEWTGYTIAWYEYLILLSVSKRSFRIKQSKYKWAFKRVAQKNWTVLKCPKKKSQVSGEKKWKWK